MNTDKRTILDLVNMWIELLGWVAERTCECRAPRDRKPLDLDCHSDYCPYPKIVRGE